MKDVLKTTLVLAIIAIVSGGLLGAVYSFTKVDTSNASTSKLRQVYYAENYVAVDYRVGGESISEPSETQIAGRVIKSYVACNEEGEQKEGLLIFWAEGDKGYGGKVQILICIENDVIKNIVSYSHSETPGLGGNALKDTHFDQYIGKNVEGVVFTVKTKSSITSADKNDPYCITAVTSATYSSNSVNNAVNSAVSYYNRYKDKLLDATITEVE